MLVSGPILSLREIHQWVLECQKISRDLSGEAQLGGLEPELQVKLKTSDRLGHLSLEVRITPDYLKQDHRFKAELDQSYLPKIIAEGRRVLEAFEFKGTGR